MSPEIIKELLIAIGYTIKESDAKKVEETAKRVERTVTAADKRTTDASAVGSAKRVLQANREAGIRTKGAAALIASLKQTETAEKTATTTVVTEHAKRSDAAKTYALAFASALTGIAAAAVSATAFVQKMASGMEQVFYASKRTGSSAGGIRAFGYAAEQLGSSSNEAIGALESLAHMMKASPGYEAMFRSLGVPIKDASGKMLSFEQRVLALGKILGKMPTHQRIAYGEGALGLPAHVLDALTSGEMQKAYDDYQALLAKAGLDPTKADKDSKAFMDVYRRLASTIGIIGIKVQGALVGKFGAQLERFTSYVLDNADSIARACIRIGDGILAIVTKGVDLVKAFNDLSPTTRDMIIKFGAMAGALLLFASGPIGALLALAGGIAVLLDDYKKWKDGSTDTLIDWGKWGPPIEKLMGFIGSDGLMTLAFVAFGAMLTAKVLGPLTSVLGLISRLGTASLAPWLAGLLGVGAVVGGAAAANSAGILTGGEGSRSWHERAVRALDPGVADRIYGKTSGDAAGAAKDDRTLLQRIMPKALGGKDAPAASVTNGGLDYSGSSGPVGKLARGANVKSIIGELKAAGYGDNAIAAVVGSMQTESSFNPRAANNQSGGHTGLWQWDRNRWPRIERWIKSQGGDPFDASWQTKAWIAEHNAKPGDAMYDHRRTQRGGEILRSNPSMEDAIHGVRESERFGPGEEGGRAANARKWLPHVQGAVQQSASEQAGAFPNGAPRVLKPNSMKDAPGETMAEADARQKADAARNSTLRKSLDAAKDFNDRFGNAPPGQGLIDGKAVSPFSRTPLGVGPSTTNNARSMTMGDRIINVHGVSDAAEVSRAVARVEDRTNADLIRNMQGAFG